MQNSFFSKKERDPCWNRASGALLARADLQDLLANRPGFQAPDGDSSWALARVRQRKDLAGGVAGAKRQLVHASVTEEKERGGCAGSQFLPNFELV